MAVQAKARKFVLRNAFQGVPKPEDFEIVEEDLPPLKDEEFLCEAEWWTVDPYMRFFGKIGEQMLGEQVARVTQSKAKEYEVGTLVIAFFGWRTHTVCPLSSCEMLKMRKVEPMAGVSASTALGILGMPGATAYFGVKNICQPKRGEGVEGEQTLVVTAASGAVGSVVGQIAKIMGCRTVGFAGSDEKVEYVKNIGFDAAFNYKTMGSLEDTLKAACPKGIDMYFDNVGGEFFEVILSQMNTFGRVAVCGAISQYNATEPPKARPVSQLILRNQLRVEGFNVFRWFAEWPKALKEIKAWIDEGKLEYREHVFEGFEKMPEAFISLFKGQHIGKVVVKKL